MISFGRKRVSASVLSFSGVLLAGLFLLNRPNREAYNIALEFLQHHRAAIKNADYLAVIDLTKPSFLK